MVGRLGRPAQPTAIQVSFSTSRRKPPTQPTCGIQGQRGHKSEVTHLLFRFSRNMTQNIISQARNSTPSGALVCFCTSRATLGHRHYREPGSLDWDKLGGFQPTLLGSCRASKTSIIRHGGQSTLSERSPCRDLSLSWPRCCATQGQNSDLGFSFKALNERRFPSGNVSSLSQSRPLIK